MSDLEQILDLLKELPAEKRQAIEKAAVEHTKHRLWVPNPGYQEMAYRSLADELFTGGEPGGGKSIFLVGTAIVDHSSSIIFRREYPQIKGLEDTAESILGGRKGYNAQTHVWRFAPGRMLEFGSVPHEKDKTRYQGRPHPLKGFDEITHFTRSQYRYLTLWNRLSAGAKNPNERRRIIATGNPPTTPEGMWVIEHWKPWLDETYHDPAEPGELRWAVPADDDSDKELFFGSLEEAVAHIEANLANPAFFDANGKAIPPRSRTFVPLPLDENQDYVRSGYKAVLAYASKDDRGMASGDFAAGIADHPDQVVPTAWITASQERWHSEGWRESPMTAMAFDPAGGGRDAAVLAWRHRGWFAQLIAEQGKSTADDTVGAGSIFLNRRDNAAVVVDMGGGYGRGIKARLDDNKVEFVAFNGALDSTARPFDVKGEKPLGNKVKFANKRAEAWWRLREALDPGQDGGSIIALPPDPELRADLAAPRLKPRTLEIRAEILLETKDEIRQRLGRSPGKGDAVVMCWSEGAAAVARAIRRSVPRPTTYLPQGGGTRHMRRMAGR